MENNKEYNDALLALKEEYEQKLSKMEAECALLRKKEKDADDQRKVKRAKEEEYLNEYVSIKLFRDNDKYKDDVYVAVTGKNCIIKRGEWVKVRRKFALVLDQSEIQDLKTAAFLEAEQKKFEAESTSVALAYINFSFCK